MGGAAGRSVFFPQSRWWFPKHETVTSSPSSHKVSKDALWWPEKEQQQQGTSTIVPPHWALLFLLTSSAPPRSSTHTLASKYTHIHMAVDSTVPLSSPLLPSPPLAQQQSLPNTCRWRSQSTVHNTHGRAHTKRHTLLPLHLFVAWATVACISAAVAALGGLGKQLLQQTLALVTAGLVVNP